MSDASQRRFLYPDAMERYQNLDGDSGVLAYETGADYIKLRFRNGASYVYDYVTPGAEHVERMRELARAGRGLSTYVSRHVGGAYARKE
jgi:hypothetical protein